MKLPRNVQTQLEKFAASLGALAGTCARLGGDLRKMKQPARRRPRRKNKSGRRRIFWTAEDLRQLRKLYPIMRTDELAKRLGRTTCSVYGAANVLNLHKSKAYLKSGAPDINKKANAGCFRQGLVPWNKGKKIGTRGRAGETQFKKGHRPHTWRPVGARRLGDGYLYEKITEGRIPVRRNWEMVHILLWRKHHGRIPRDHIVVFKDKDRSNITIDNLELITKGENMRRNTIHNLPEPVKDIIRWSGVLKRAINKRKKHEDD